MSGLALDGTAEPVSRDQSLRRERGQGKYVNVSCSVDHKQDWQLYAVDLFSAEGAEHTSTVRGLLVFDFRCFAFSF